MKVKLLLLSISVLVSACSGPRDASQNNPVTDTNALLDYQNEITTDYLRSHLEVLAHDSLEGRGTGTPGIEKAADYLADQYGEMGLKPIGDNQSYFQNFDLKAEKTDSIVYEVFKSDAGEQSQLERSVSNQKDVASFVRAFGGTDTLSGEIIFAGFGVNDSSNKVAHLEGMDLKGKWVLVFQDIPNIVEGDTLIDPAVTGQRRFRTVITQLGAEGILLIPTATTEEFREVAMQSRVDFGQPSGLRLDYLNNGYSGFSKGYNVVSPDMAARLLNLENGEKGLQEVRASLIENLTEFRPKSTGYALTQTPYVSDVTVETKNVLALFEGADPELKDEVVVLTSHYDHVGIGQPDSTGDSIYNGADDDGSGTVGLLNVARALSEARENGVAPKRSVLFLHVTAEEKGLLGSRYYSDHPVLPIENTIANINIDMIGRIDPEHERQGISDYAYIIGSEIISSQMDSLLTVANSQSGDIQLNKKYNDLQDPNQFYRRSDHWNFGRLGVPFVFFFTGVHEDYHQPGDEVHKIEFDKMSRIVRTIYATTIMTANAENPPVVDNQAFIDITKTN